MYMFLGRSLMSEEESILGDYLIIYLVKSFIDCNTQCLCLVMEESCNLFFCSFYNKARKQMRYGKLSLETFIVDAFM